MKKRIISLILTACFMLSLVIVLPNDALYTDASAALNYSGGTRNSATFIIDPGHGGGDPGAVNGSRHEADDVLKLSIAVAKLIDNYSSYSCALTRTTDVTQSLATKCSIANSGSFTYFLSIHRNAGGGTGIETYYHSNRSSTSSSAKLATAVNNALNGVGCWKNRGVKTAALYVCGNTNFTAALTEVGFIDTAADNTTFDKYFDANAKAIANGLLSMVGSSVNVNTVSAPTVTVASTVAHNTTLAVSWGAVTNATSYQYTVTTYAGEPSATSAKTVVSTTTTTGTSFTVPAQSSGKYMKIKVTAVGSQNSASATKTVLMGPYEAYPTTMQYIPVGSINGSQWTTGGSTIWTSSQTSAFTAVYWDVFVCSPNSDGTYTVNTVYRSSQSKSVTVTGTNIIFAIHEQETNYTYANAIVAGDKLTFKGVYIDNATIRGSGYVLVNGGVSLSVTAPNVTCPTEVEVGNTASVSWATVPNATSYNYKVVLNDGTIVTEATGVTAKSFTIPAVKAGTSMTVTVTAVGAIDSKTTTKTVALKVTAPQDITSSNTNVQKVDSSKAFRGFDERSTAESILASFNEDSKFLVVYDTAGNTVESTGMVATGYTVNVVVNGSVTVSYELVVTGDVTGDGVVSSSDYVAEAKALKSELSLTGAYALALDYNCDNTVSSLDIIALAAHIS